MNTRDNTNNTNNTKILHVLAAEANLQIASANLKNINVQINTRHNNKNSIAVEMTVFNHDSSDNMSAYCSSDRDINTQTDSFKSIVQAILTDDFETVRKQTGWGF